MKISETKIENNILLNSENTITTNALNTNNSANLLKKIKIMPKNLTKKEKLI